jgi:HSP90 family molecular chaperone
LAKKVCPHLLSPLSLLLTYQKGVKLDDKEVEEDKKKTEEEYKPLVEYMKDALSEKLEKVIVTDRLTTSPCALVSSSYGYTANMERIIKAQALGVKGYG